MSLMHNCSFLKLENTFTVYDIRVQGFHKDLILIAKYHHYWGKYSGADPGRGERGSSHGQIFSALEYFALTFFKISDLIFCAILCTLCVQ